MEYIIPINPESEEVDKVNKEHGTDYKTTNWHADECVTTFIDALADFMENNTLYIGDRIKVKVEITYEPEDK